MCATKIKDFYFKNWLKGHAILWPLGKSNISNKNYEHPWTRLANKIHIEEILLL